MSGVNSDPDYIAPEVLRERLAKGGEVHIRTSVRPALRRPACCSGVTDDVNDVTQNRLDRLDELEMLPSDPDFPAPSPETYELARRLVVAILEEMPSADRLSIFQGLSDEDHLADEGTIALVRQPGDRPHRRSVEICAGRPYELIEVDAALTRCDIRQSEDWREVVAFLNAGVVVKVT